MQERLHRGIYLLPCYLQGHRGRFSWLECFLVVSSSAEVPSAPSSAAARSHLCHIPLSAVSSCDCVRTGLERLFLVGVRDLNQHQKQSTTHGYSADLQDKKCLLSKCHIHSIVIYSDCWWLIEAQCQMDHQTSSKDLLQNKLKAQIVTHYSHRCAVFSGLVISINITWDLRLLLLLFHYRRRRSQIVFLGLDGEFGLERGRRFIGSILSPSSSDNRSALREIMRRHYETLVSPPGPRATVEASDWREVSVAFVASCLPRCKEKNKLCDSTQLSSISPTFILEYMFLDI